jgi:hypothetical protein
VDVYLAEFLVLCFMDVRKVFKFLSLHHMHALEFGRTVSLAFSLYSLQPKPQSSKRYAKWIWIYDFPNITREYTFRWAAAIPLQLYAWLSYEKLKSYVRVLNTCSFRMYWTNCAFGLYPSSGVSRTNKIEELRIIDKRSQYTCPQTNHTRVNY